jgi:hypothetical protein
LPACGSKLTQGGSGLLSACVACNLITAHTLAKQVHRTKALRDKFDKVNAILAAMRDAYEVRYVDGDFDDAFHYYTNFASDEELDADFEKWCPAEALMQKK